MSCLLHQMSATYSHCRLKAKNIKLTMKFCGIVLWSSSQGSFQVADWKHSKKYWLMYLVVHDTHTASVKTEILLHFSKCI